MEEKVVLKSITTVLGEQCVMMDSLTQLQQLSAILSDSGSCRTVDLEVVSSS